MQYRISKSKMVFVKIAVVLAFAHLGYSRVILTSSPPEAKDRAKMARYIISNSDWVSIATISAQEAIQGYPFVSLKSMSDGPPSNSTGVPYFLLTELGGSGKDLQKDNRSTIMATLAQSDYCKKQDLDPQDPRCAKVFITGKIIKIDPKSPEFPFAQNALFSKHPQMKFWPQDHSFYIAKLDIEQMAVFSYFGGSKFLSVEDYFNAKDFGAPAVVNVEPLDKTSTTRLTTLDE